MHTACVWSEKTTVCRIFSCQRTRELVAPRRRYSRFDAPSQRVARLLDSSPAAEPRQQSKAGGEYRARTGDLLVANQALSQLS